MSRVYRWRQTVTYTVTMLDVGAVDEETGETLTAEVADESAEEWMRSAMPIEYYPEDFVDVEQGPVEYLGMTLTPRLSTEDEVRGIVDGKLVKMREYKP